MVYVSANEKAVSLNVHRYDEEENGELADAADAVSKSEVRRRLVHVVALQVAFERQTLKPGFQLIGYRLWG
jgi:hypothetical protein